MLDFTNRYNDLMDALRNNNDDDRAEDLMGELLDLYTEVKAAGFWTEFSTLVFG